MVWRMHDSVREHSKLRVRLKSSSLGLGPNDLCDLGQSPLFWVSVFPSKNKGAKIVLSFCSTFYIFLVKLFHQTNCSTEVQIAEHIEAELNFLMRLRGD